MPANRAAEGADSAFITLNGMDLLLRRAIKWLHSVLADFEHVSAIRALDKDFAWVSSTCHSEFCRLTKHIRTAQGYPFR